MSFKNVVRRRRNMKSGLRDLIKYIDLDNIVMVEVGSYAGESTEIFCESSNVQRVYAIDPWVNGYDPKDRSSQRIEMAKVEAWFDERMARFDNLIKLKKASEEAIQDFEDNSLDLVYIDGNHQYDAVCNDIKMWLPKIVDNGYIAGHDFTSKPKVKQAVLDTLGKPEKTFGDSSWIFKVSSVRSSV